MQPIRVDGDNLIDWGKTSSDYSSWRPTYPDRFFEMLASLGVGRPGQKIVDLGTGVGFLAQRFAQAGAIALGVDISEEQIREARRRCEILGVDAEFIVAPAEQTGLQAASFDAVTASQSWLYFDKNRIIPEVKRLLKPDGLLVTSHFCWLPRRDPIASMSEQLVLKHNPKWTGADWSGEVPLVPKWSEEEFRLHGMFVFDEAVVFTRESWRGRIRACRGVGATLGPAETEAFDREHQALLESRVPEKFSVLHRIDAHILRTA